MTWRLLFIVLLCIVQLLPLDARLWQAYCDLRTLPLVEIARDPVTLKFEQTGIVISEDGAPISPTAGDTEGQEATLASNSTEEGKNYEDWFRMYARNCDCAHPTVGDVFCPAGYDFCAIPSTFWNENWFPACVNFDKRQSFVRRIWPVCYIWLFALTVFLFFTRGGRTVIDYVFSCIYPRWPRIVADRILERDPTRTRQLLRDYSQRRRRELERLRRRGEEPDMTDELPPVMMVVEEERRPTRLALKTRIYHASENEKSKIGPGEEKDDENEEDEPLDCAICFSAIEDGEKVGALLCDHIFHSECLKSWLTRRAVCPLCQRTDVAKLLYDDEVGNSV